MIKTTIHPIITVGQIFKNYKELCKYLGLPVLDGNSKKSQLKHLSQFFTLEQDGQKLTVVEVLKPIYTKEDFYMDKDILDNYIELLLLQMFADEDKTEMYISKTKLWEKLGMVNKDYFMVDYEALNEEYQKTHNYHLKEWAFNVFKSRVNKTNNNKLEQTLDHLQNRKLITWNKVYYEIKKGTLEHFVVDNPEKEQFILSCERKALDDVVGKTVEQTTKNGKKRKRQSNLSDVYAQGKIKKYNNRIYEYLSKGGISGAYKKYRIILNESNLLQEALKIDCNNLCRKINERMLTLVDNGICSVSEKYIDSKTDIKEMQKWLSQRLVYLGWHIEHFFDNKIENFEESDNSELEKELPWN